MSFHRPILVEVEEKKLVCLKKAVREITSHLEKNNLDQSEHRDHLNRRINELERLVLDIVPIKPQPYETTD